MSSTLRVLIFVLVAVSCFGCDRVSKIATLLERIHEALGDTGSSAGFEQLQRLESVLRPEAERLLALCEPIAHRLREQGSRERLGDVERVSSAFRRLLALSRQMLGEPEMRITASGPPAPDAPVPARPAPRPATETAGRLLVAEDNADNRDLLRRRLEREGHRVWEVENGAQALEKLAAEEFDLLLLDVMMPEMDGFEVLARLKRDPRLRDLPVIMISALDEIQSVVRCIQMGAEDYLPKPFDPVLLRARIGASLEKKRLRDRERRKTEELEQALQRLKETQEQLVVQEKMASLGALTAGIAHEIKNPLNFVTNFAELSADLLGDLCQALEPVRAGLAPEEAANLDEIVSSLTGNLQRIREHGKRADSIVRGMLAHSRGSSGRRENVDLNALIAEAVNLAYHGLRARDPNFNVLIECDYDQAQPHLLAVPQDLSRVFLNVINNGCYAANERRPGAADAFRPTLRVTTRNWSDTVEVRIRDNGAGIPKDVMPKIFNPFFTTKPAGSGTGLGLSLSYQIVVEQHKGTIRAESQEGEYTEFVITLPKGK